ncbi:alpha/beta fold hydrolase [Streptomyces sp. NPDC006703]|uniref:alpha/beta fold hydrolase n=1 Tax=Streptomyces sp. NPDC006703 TaxID=3364759 RepID=UPI00369F118E
MSRHLRVPVADTVLDANDTEGSGPPVLLLNGGFATQRFWKDVVPLLADRYRVVTFDGRGRGKSGISGDYSFAGCLDDVHAVLDATGLKRPILAGWSYGAAIAVRYAARHPDQVAGVVNIDGAMPLAPIDDALRNRIRKQFRSYAIPMKIMAALGLSSRMSAAQAADMNIEYLDILTGFAADYAQTQCPVACIKATGKHQGATEQEMREARANLDAVIASNPHVTDFATVPSNHRWVVAKHSDTIAAAVDAVASKVFPAP